MLAMPRQHLHRRKSQVLSLLLGLLKQRTGSSPPYTCNPQSYVVRFFGCIIFPRQLSWNRSGASATVYVLKCLD